MENDEEIVLDTTLPRNRVEGLYYSAAGVKTEIFDMIIETYRGVFLKEVDLELDDEDWEDWEAIDELQK